MSDKETIRDVNYAKPVIKRAGGKYLKSTEQTKVKPGRVVGSIPVPIGGMSNIAIKRPGQPTKYKRKYCEDIINYFVEAQPLLQIVDDPGGKGGTSTHFETLYIPTVRGFAASIGISYKTLYNWCDTHVEFLHAFERACAIQDALVEQLGLAGRLGKGLAELYFMNRLEYKDSRHMDLTTDGKALPTPITALQLNVNQNKPVIEG